MVVIAILILMVVMAETFNNCVFHPVVHARINAVTFYTLFDEHICQNITVRNVQGKNYRFAVFLLIIKIFLNNNFVTFVNLCNLVDSLFRQIAFRQNFFQLIFINMPDVHLVATLMSLSRVIPEKNKEIAREVVRKVVDELMKKLSSPMQQAVTGALNRSSRRRNPRYNEIDWRTTIEKNLRNYQPEYKTIIPEVRIGFGRKRRALKDIVLCLDQSGSMGASVVYSGIFGSVLASIPAVQTRMVVFDTSVVDLTDDLQDPVDLLFGVQLGGGTDIDRALGYCQTVITRPTDTVLVLVTDLCEGGNEREMRKKMISLVQSGVQLIVLLALIDDGAPFYDKENAQFLAELGVPVFACTPDRFPDLMAVALAKQDVGMWLSKNIQ